MPSVHSALTHWYRSIQSGRVTEDPFRYSYQFIYLAHFKPRVHRRWLNIHLKLIWIIKCPKVWNYLLIFIIKINLLHSFCTHAGFSDWCLLCLHLVTLWETGFLLLCNWACERHENHLSLKLNFIKLKLVLIISVSLTPERRVKLIFEFVYMWHRMDLWSDCGSACCNGPGDCCCCSLLQAKKQKFRKYVNVNLCYSSWLSFT